MKQRYVHDGRLVYVFDSAPSGNVWDVQWKTEEIEFFLSLDSRTALGEYEPVFLPVLERAHPVLEAGCGPCRYLQALRAKGYECLGVDTSLHLLATVRRLRPDLPLADMDVRELALADNSLGACISLGVLEHFTAGMDSPLAEVHRTLRPDGLLLASVPYFNPCRQARARKGHFLSEEVPWDRFYQFALTEAEFRGILVKAGFEPVLTHYLHTVKGLRDEHPWLGGLYRLHRRMVGRGLTGRLAGRVIHPLLALVEYIAGRDWARKRYSHMVLLVARKV